METKELIITIVCCIIALVSFIMIGVDIRRESKMVIAKPKQTKNIEDTKGDKVFYTIVAFVILTLLLGIRIYSNYLERENTRIMQDILEQVGGIDSLNVILGQ